MYFVLAGMHEVGGELRSKIVLPLSETRDCNGIQPNATVRRGDLEIMQIAIAVAEGES